MSIPPVEPDTGLRGEWDELPTEMKFEVIKYLDIKSRGNFRRCSEYVDRLVNAVPIRMSSLVIIHDSRTNDIRLSISETLDKTYYSIFKKLDSRVVGSVKERYMQNDLISRVHLGNISHLKAAVSEFNAILSIPNISFQYVCINAGPDFQTDFNGEIKGDVITLGGNVRLLSKFAQNATNLSLFSEHTVKEQICATPQMKTARNIYMDLPNQNCDDYLLEYEADRIEFRQTPISNNNINLYLKKLLASSSKSLRLVFKATSMTDIDEIARDFEICKRISGKNVILKVNGGKKLNLSIKNVTGNDAMIIAELK